MAVANDAAVAAAATNRDVSEDAPSPFQDCRDVVHLSLFFDGTGNNWEKDDDTDSWSNVGRMYDAAIKNAKKSAYAIYVSGVGTPYNGKASNWLASTETWVEDTIGGSGFGAGGQRRLEQGEDAVNDRLKQVLIANAQAAGRELATYAASATAKSFTEVNDALSQHRLIKVITMSLFGFSRGAALARAFSNRVIKRSEQRGDGMYYQSYLMRHQFMGVFDTVASFGIPSTNARLPFEERDLIVSAHVKRCVHYVAAHEVRFAFPVDLIRKHGKFAGQWEERVYPGVHSDVGGGYLPESHKVSDNYARIPMRDMMREAIVSGVRMTGYLELKTTKSTLFTERFVCHTATEKAYAKYMAACGALSGTVEAQIKRHLQVFYSASGTMQRQGIVAQGERLRKANILRRLGPPGMAEEIRQHREAVKQGQGIRSGGDHRNGYTQYVKLEEWQVSAWDQTASAGVVEFVAGYIHDSKADFLLNVEPFSYFKPRGVLESTVSVWTEWGNWIGDTYESGKQQVGKAVDATTQAAKDAAAEAQRRAEALAAAAQRKAEEAARYAQRKADEARAAAKRTYDAATKAASDAADAAQRKAAEAAAYARRQAQAAADAVNRGVEATAKAGREAAASVSRKAGQVRAETQKLYDRGVNWVKRARDEWF